MVAEIVVVIILVKVLVTVVGVIDVVIVPLSQPSAGLQGSVPGVSALSYNI